MLKQVKCEVTNDGKLIAVCPFCKRQIEGIFDEKSFLIWNTAKNACEHFVGFYAGETRTEVVAVFDG